MKKNKREPRIIRLAYYTGGFPVGKKQLLKIQGMLFRQPNDLTETMREALMLIHDDWDMETIADAAYICSVVAKNRGAKGEITLKDRRHKK